ncbi:hypothetical protein BDV95DRAFT_602732 [Massariosphaeria phaeospora]|uniref:Mtf2-like C-terminal domain-containing protein n=1 Tax=Massariosphaeria phaeospora TaxID=100035 RepID=A0A7C8IHW6_9PLEO|nr:hypothetical protein BDV95DRAFT_602732 [Massariosphaeria phaeospora]
MAACSTTLGRALARAKPTTLTPFLYQTATLQQCRPAARVLGRRSLASRAPHDDHVPFADGEALPPSVDAAEAARRTTITGPERAAFETLYKAASADGHPHADTPFQPEIDRAADEYDEDDAHEKPSASLDSLFDAVLSGLPPPGQRPAQHKKKRPVENLATLAEKILRPELEEARKRSRKDATAEAARIRAIRQAEKTRVAQLLESAQTDRELWETLDREVFDLIRKLDLDGLKQNNQQQDATTTTGTSSFSTPPTSTAHHASQGPANSDPRILFPNYPYHLTVAANLLRTNFPSSALPLNILSTIKSLGRSSYALGATTLLYRLLIRTAWVQYASYDYIDELLRDMDNGGIETDPETLKLLDDILTEYQDAMAGRLGTNIRSVWSMDQFAEGIKKIRAWRETVAIRLGTSAHHQGPVRRKTGYGDARPVHSHLR